MLLQLLQLLLVPPCLLSPHGHALRVGALLPAQRAARAQVQAALSRAAAAMSQDPEPEPEPGRKWANFLPHSLSLELLPRQPAAADPESVLRCVCEGAALQGLGAVLAFPQSRDELLQVELMASALEIPFLSVLEHEEPLRTQVHLPPRTGLPVLVAGCDGL